MDITLNSIENNIVTLYVERKQGKYNNVLPVVEVPVDPTLYTREQLASLAWDKCKDDVLVGFSRVWENRITPEMKVYEDTPIYGEPEFDEYGNIKNFGIPIWAIREDITPINEDNEPNAISPFDEAFVFTNFIYEKVELPIIKPPVSEYEKMSDMFMYLMTNNITL